MAKQLARRAWDPMWRQASGQLPEGPVTLWMTVFSDDQRFLGAAPMTANVAWAWKDGRLCASYGTVQVIVTEDGRYETGVIVAVSGRQYVPVFRISLGEPQEVRAGWDICVYDGLIAIIPDPGFAADRSAVVP
jgi:hypothetical protein